MESTGQSGAGRDFLEKRLLGWTFGMGGGAGKAQEKKVRERGGTHSSNM